MKKLLLAGLTLAVAGASFAQVFEFGGDLEERTIDMSGEGPVRNSPTIVYQGIAGNPNYSAFAAVSGVLGVDDYSAAWVGDFTLDSIRFVGNVGAAGQGLSFEFFDAASVFRGAFNVTFTTSAASIWNITGLSGLNILADDIGFMQIRTVGAGTGRWWLTSVAPVIGGNSNTFGGGNNGALRHAFELTAVPEPGTMTALALGGAALLRRRRVKK